MYFFALAAAGLMTACSSDDAVSNGGGADETALVPIQIGVSPTEVTTRGTGTVGGTGTDADPNNWAGQLVKIYMLERGSMKVAEFTNFNDETYPTVIYKNAEFKTPTTGTTGIATATDNSIKYYPLQGKFDFWGYRIDDATALNESEDGGLDYTSGPVAVNAEGAKVEDADIASAVAYVTKFSINGSQDIMSGKAALTSTQTAQIENDGTWKEEKEDDYYSSYAARHGVQPSITFNHLLTRLNFVVKPGTAKAAGSESEDGGVSAVKIHSIKVTSPYIATLPVAYTADYTGEQGISFEKEEDGSYETTQFTLMQRNSGEGTTAADDLVAIDETNGISLEGQWDNDADKAKTLNVGEALLVAPGLSEYTLEGVMSQKVPVSTTTTDLKEVKVPFTAKIKLTDGGNFVAGSTYTVNITLYSLEKIEVTADLKAWEQGGETEEIESDDNATDDNTDTTGGDGSGEEV